MKRLSFLTLCLLAVALTASINAQPVPLYGEIYTENSNKFMGRIWTSQGKIRGEASHDNQKNLKT